jgi:hypothetical protein
MKRIQKATVKQPDRLHAPRRSWLSSLKLSKDGSSRRILRKAVRTTELPEGDIANQPKLPVGYYVYTITVAGVVPVYRKRERPAAILPHEGGQEPPEARL